MLDLRIHPNVLKEQVIHGLEAGDTVLDGANLMVRHDISAIVIFGDDGEMTGIVTEHDLTRRVLADQLDPKMTTLGEIMTENPDTLSPEDAVLDALELMRTRRYRHLPVIKDDRVIGMVSIRDLYEAVQDSLEQSMLETEALVFSRDKND
jgi:CBS domain-containing protein